ncbi:MAG: bifunctional methylenetetrahydrofolate dehydrogenase/methenyltetrahydrofolate cyclohydrolase FolD [Acidimicrobiia bacterium]
MSARILSGREAARAVRQRVAEQLARLGAPGREVGLASVLVGDDPASHLYVTGKHRAAEELGIRSFDHRLPAGTAQDELEALVERLNLDPQVDGILVQLPLPDLDEQRVLELVDPRKDVDGLHPVNLGRLVLGRPGLVPATPQGVMALLHHFRIATRGRLAVVVGRSFLVGRPLALLLGSRGTDATVVQAHSQTPDLASLTRQADILVIAIGRPGFIGPEHVKPGATVVDVGITRQGDRVHGDVDFEAVAEVAGAITPVPGGVGPMTVAMLLANTVAAAGAFPPPSGEG